MVRIKAKTMAAASYAPKNGYTPAQLDQCGNHYNSYFPPNTYQQPCPAHMPAQQLYDFTNEAWASAVTGYQECADVSLSIVIKASDRVRTALCCWSWLLEALGPLLSCSESRYVMSSVI